jgi:hypothetical protein
VSGIGLIVDAVDGFLEDLHDWSGRASSDSAFGGLHARFPAPGARAVDPPLDRVEFLRRRSALRRVRGELRRATAGLLFLRNKLEAEQTERRVRMARACHALLRATRENDDETALPLLSYRDVMRASLRRAEEELAGVRTQAADAKDALARLARAEDQLEAAHRHARTRAPRRAARG